MVPRDVGRAAQRRRVPRAARDQPPPLGVEAAYVLSCASLTEAHDIVAREPLVSSGCMRVDVVEWQLVGVNPDAVERELLIRPEDVSS